MSARAWDPRTWLARARRAVAALFSRRDAGVRFLTDLVDQDLAATDFRAALREAALLAQRGGVVFAAGVLSVDEVIALAWARERLELERAQVLEGLLRDLAQVLKVVDPEAQALQQLGRALAAVRGS